MNADRRNLLLDLLAGTSAIVAFAVPLQIEKVYHGNHGLSLRDALLVVFICTHWLTVLASWVRQHPHLYRIARSWTSLSVVLGLFVSFSPELSKGLGTRASVALFLCLGSFTAVLAGWLSAVYWERFRRVIAITPWLLTLPSIFIGYLFSKPLVWLDAPAAVATPTKKTATIAILFDELNAKNSAGLRATLEHHGLTVSWKPLTPMGKSTAEVVPSMFTGEFFPDAKACGFTQICSHSNALDFSKISVNRPDVDVVGFYHPYCAIKGLRWCRRISTETSVLQRGRLHCFFQKHFGLDLGFNARECQVVRTTPWATMRAKTISAMMDAPTLREGGVLFAHLPIPHPPANGLGTLSEQYHENLLASEILLDTILHRLQSNRLSVTTLIFSDHPLRQSTIWCAVDYRSFDLPCVENPKIADSDVPLIIATDSFISSTQSFSSNNSIFTILRSLLAPQDTM